MNKKATVFDNGLKQGIKDYIELIKKVYLSDEIPWVVGYSGGKDSTATLQLVWTALSELPISKRKKEVHVISTDTLVENPIVAHWVNQALQRMKNSAERQDLPIIPHRLMPTVEDSFWVNLIGKGYPAPRPKFRWCTVRLKIHPSNNFIKEIVDRSNQAIVVLGTRKTESQARGRVMEKIEAKRERYHLSPNKSLPGSLVFSPIENWYNDDVWLYLMQYKNPWDGDNKELLTMYQGASSDGECPLVVDSDTPSCGSSRFGCWVCTLVDKDKSMEAMILNDSEKDWMLPLLDLRNEIDFRGDKNKELDLSRRDFRRMHGNVMLFNDNLIRGPYTQEARAYWLKRVLEVHNWINHNKPDEICDYEVISINELKEIRRIWITEKHEFEDLLPDIYSEIMGKPFPDDVEYNCLPIAADDLQVLKEVCGEDKTHYEMVRNLLDIERRYQATRSRYGLYDNLESIIKRGYFDDAQEALEIAKNNYKQKSPVEILRKDFDFDVLTKIVEQG